MAYVVAISVEKIQKYIFHAIDQNQVDEKTLKNIILSSEHISKNFLEEVENKFKLCDGTMQDKILWISGKVIFYSKMTENEIKNNLKELFQKVYIEYCGNIFLNYVFFPARNIRNTSKMHFLKEAERLLVSDYTKSKVISDNSDILFRFEELENKKINLEYERKKFKENVFLDSMDELVVLDEKHVTDSSNGKIAVVKADFNNLGQIMKEINDYDEYIKLSSLLENKISLKKFEIEVGKIKTLINKIVPFYVAGDDIFYATRIDTLLDSIKVLKNIIKEINRDIENILTRENKMELSVAVGVSFVNNHQPVRYYRQIVEKELFKIKKKMKTEKAFNSILGICMENNFFYIYKEKLGFWENDGFNRFCDEISELQKMMNEKVFSRTSLHNLLINLEIEKDNDRRMLYCLYFFKPNIQGEDIYNTEQYKDLHFKYYWLSHLVEGKRYKPGKKEREFVPEKIEEVLIPKLKLVLLFLKERYCVSSECSNYKYIIPSVTSSLIDQKRRIRSVMFHKPINYLLNKLEPNSIELLFIKRISVNRKYFYVTSNFEPAVFYRAKKLIEFGKSKQVETIFENYSCCFNEVDTARSKSIHTMSLDKEKLKEKLNEVLNGKSDTKWLDRLILLHEYNYQRIILKTIEKKGGKL